MYQYLFFLERGKISVIYYSSQSKRKLNYEPNAGENTFLIKEDFWIWWKNAASYLDGEEVDFCFIYDREYEILQDEFVKTVKQTEKSCWNRQIVGEFFMEIGIYSHVVLYMENGDEWRFDQQNIEFMDNSLRTFYTNLCWTTQRSGEGRRIQEQGKGISEEEELTAFARYYKGLLEAERQRS